MSRSLIKIFSILLLVSYASCAPGVQYDFERDALPLNKRACHPSKSSFENAGFDTGKLSPWTFGRTNKSLPMTAEVVTPGYKSRHAAEIYALVPPSDDDGDANTGRLNQTIRICNPTEDGEYRVSWWLYQVPGATQYEDYGFETLELSVFMIEDSNGYYNYVGDFDLYKTYLTCSFCKGTRHYAAGTWHNFYGTFYPDSANYLMTLQFRLYVTNYGGENQPVETRFQIDGIEINEIKSN